MAYSCIFVLWIFLVLGSDAFSFNRYKSYLDYIKEKRLKPTTTSTLSSTTNGIGIGPVESGYDKILKSENNQHSWDKSPVTRVIIEVLVGCFLSCFTGTSCVCLFKFVRNKNRCKPSWFTFKFIGYKERHQVEESIYEEPIELVVTGPGNPAVA